MKYIIIFVCICFSIGCRSSTAPINVKYSDLNHWERVDFAKVGITLEAPEERFNERQIITSSLERSGCMIAGFDLHEFSGDFLMERTYGIQIYFAVYSKEEWQNYLRGDRWLLYDDRYGEYKNKFCHRYYKWRKDTKASDGRVLVAFSSGPASAYNRSEKEAAEDEIAIRRIIESARFINP